MMELLMAFDIQALCIYMIVPLEQIVLFYAVVLP